MREAAIDIGTHGDEATRRAASARLAQVAQAVTQQRWDSELLRVLEAMHAVGGPEAVAYAFWLAENEYAPAWLRRAALFVVARHADLRDPSARARGAALWVRLNGGGTTPVMANP